MQVIWPMFLSLINLPNNDKWEINELNNGDLQVIPMKGLPMTTNWNLIWLSSKNLSAIAKHFVDHINDNKSSIIENHFNWFEKY